MLEYLRIPQRDTGQTMASLDMCVFVVVYNLIVPILCCWYFAICCCWYFAAYSKILTAQNWHNKVVNVS